MDAPCKIQGSIHVFRLVNNMCPGKWVHIMLLIGSFFFTESLPPEKRISGGIATAFKNYGALLKDSSFLGQTLV